MGQQNSMYLDWIFNQMHYFLLTKVYWLKRIGLNIIYIWTGFILNNPNYWGQSNLNYILLLYFDSAKIVQRLLFCMIWNHLKMHIHTNKSTCFYTCMSIGTVLLQIVNRKNLYILSKGGSEGAHIYRHIHVAR